MLGVSFDQAPGLYSGNATSDWGYRSQRIGLSPVRERPPSLVQRIQGIGQVYRVIPLHTITSSRSMYGLRQGLRFFLMATCTLMLSRSLK